jgi:hypothetical protein
MRKLTYAVGADTEAGQNAKKGEISHIQKEIKLSRQIFESTEGLT